MSEFTTKTLTNFTNEEFERVFETDTSVQLSGYCFSLRKMKRMVFLVLRKHNLTVQCIVMKRDKPNVFALLSDLPEESTITVEGVLTKPPNPVVSCDVTDYEVQIHNVKVISRAQELPFFVSDANEILVTGEKGDELAEGDESEKDVESDVAEVEGRINVPRSARLENRWIDLRANNNYTILQLRSALLNSMRKVALDEEEFIEVSTPKIIPAVSESGASVFDLNYFGRKAYLAQSPQLYKQMLINSGMKGVFEVGPVFRAENSCTYRHLCEFTGMDFEFPIEVSENHYDIVRRIWSILLRGFNNFYTQNIDRIEQIFAKTGVEKPVIPEEPLIIGFCNGVDMLNEAGFTQSKLEDIGSVNERELGKLVKEKHGSDLFVLMNYPSSARPFYTMVDYRTNLITGQRIYSDYSRSFDIIFRCNEISSGAQRNHDPDVLTERIKLSGIKLDFANKSTGLEDYVRSFEYGSMPHGGCGIGVERLVMLYLGLPNVRSVSIFPRDPKTISP